MRVAVVFPGQGTQRPGMGAPWRGHPAWSVVERAEEVTGSDLGGLVVDADGGRLARTRDAQLAVLVTSLTAWEAVRDRLPQPVAFAGHSLGQVTALVAAGALGLDDGLRVAADRAEATQEAADARPGRMAAVLGLDREQVEEACRDVPDCWVANDNAPGQVVVGGTATGVEALTTRARDVGARKVMPLDVGGAFHTPLMSDAADELGRRLDGVAFGRPSAPVVANTDATPHADDDWRDRLTRHLVSPVEWRRSQHALAGLGADLVVEVGTGGMLAGLARRTVPDLPVVGVATPDDLGRLAEALTAGVAR